MALFLNTGVPGSGKSYLMIKRLLDSFYKWDSKLKKFFVRPDFPDFVLISNVEGLKLDHVNLETMMESVAKFFADQHIIDNNIISVDAVAKIQRQFYDERLKYFFSVDYWEIQPKKTYVFMIEECQTYFGTNNFSKKSYVDDVLFYFQRHRHLGHSFFLDTQSGGNLNRAFYSLVESEMEAKPRTLSVVGEFKYFELSGGHAINTVPKIVKPDKRIYSIYKSFNMKESLKPSSPVKRFFFILAGLFLLIFIGYKFVVWKMSPEIDKTTQELDKRTLYEVASPSSPPSQSVRPPVVNASVPNNFNDVSGTVVGDWVRVNYILRKDGTVLIEHPVFKTIIKPKDVNFPLRRSGGSLFAYIIQPQQNNNYSLPVHSIEPPLPPSVPVVASSSSFDAKAETERITKEIQAYRATHPNLKSFYVSKDAYK